MSTEAKGGGSKRSIYLLMEDWGPIACGILVFSILLYFGESISPKFGRDLWQSSSLYSAIFDWSAIQTGFAFGVYGFVVGKSDGFISKIRNTRAMSRFAGYIKRANLTGFLLTISSIPLIVVNPDISSPDKLAYTVVSIWFSVFIWSFMSFLRLAYNFGIIASVKDKEFKGA